MRHRRQIVEGASKIHDCNELVIKFVGIRTGDVASQKLPGGGGAQQFRLPVNFPHDPRY